MTQNTTLAPKQILLRLPEDLAARLASAVAPRQRNRFLVDVVSKALARQEQAQRRALAEAAKAMNALEMQHPALARETRDWVDAPMSEPLEAWDPDFDREAFELGLAEARQNGSPGHTGQP